MKSLAQPVLSVTSRGKLTILIYHRVHRDVDPLFPGDVDARRFDEQMSWIAAALNVVPLREAVDMLQQHRLPARAAAITFDDGYADNAEIALPILRRHRLPATFFISTGFLDGGRMWNDTIVESMRRAPATGLDLGPFGLAHRALPSPSARRTTIDEIIGTVKYLEPTIRQAKVDALAHAVGTPLPSDLMMRSEQVRALHVAGMSIGAHTVTHPILARIDDTRARAEICDGRDALVSILGAPVELFAYPNGRPSTDYGPSHVAIVRELGFTAAVSTRAGAADAASDPFQLPRFTPWARTFARFALGLARNNLGHY